MTREELYARLDEMYQRTDWDDLDSIRAYNVYARNLRKELDKED